MRSVMIPAVALAVFVGSGALAPRAAAGQDLRPSFTLEEILSPSFSYELVSARDVDRIAWLENREGVRNVFTAVPPDFAPVQLTAMDADDGVDLTGLQIAADGSVVTFIRGHAPNGDGWVANPSSDASGGERVIHAGRTDGSGVWAVGPAGGAPALSPNGRWIVQVVEGAIHRLAVEPGASTPGVDDPGARDAGPLFRVRGSAGSPRWSPDGSRLAFVADRDGHSFVAVYHVDAHRLLYLAPGVDRDGSPVWSPDGSRVAFVRRPGLAFGGRAGLPDGVSRQDVPEGLMRSVLPGGATLALWTADPETGEGRALWDNAGTDGRFTDVSEVHWGDGHLVFQSEPGNWEHHFSVAVDDPGSEPVHLTPGDGFVEMAHLPSGGGHLYYSTNIGDPDRRHLWRVPVGGGDAEQLTGGEGIATFPAVLASGDRVAMLVAGAALPQSVGVVASSGGEPRVVGPPLPTTFPAQAHVRPENVVLTADDGLTFHNQLFLPPDMAPGERRPALIFLHGGPRRQMLLGYNYGHFYHMAYAVNQYFANKGYVVLSVNYRRGIGYGKAFRETPNAREQGMDEYRDLLAAGHYIRDRDDVDPDRVALWGLSYGGTMTGLGLARNSDLFAAGVDIAGVHFFVTPRDEHADEVDPGSVAYQASSAPLVEQWTSPVLLVHGDDDRNVPFFQTAGLVQALRVHGVPHELIVFPDEVHAFLVHARWLETFRAMDSFLDRTLFGQERVGGGGGGGG